MQLIKSLSKSKVMRLVALALVLAGAVSFQKAVLADAGNGDRTLIIRAFDGDPLNDKRIGGVNLRVNGGSDNGLSGVTDGSGTFVFHVHEGNFAVTASHNDYYTIDIPVLMDIGELTVDVSMTPKAVVTPPNPPTPPPAGSECTPTPPRGRPLLNIWPISTSGAECTDYPLLSVKNVTQNTGWVSGSNVNANAGDTVRVELYVHNGVLDYPDNIAHNVMVSSAINGGSITASAWADNADRITSAQKGGNAGVNLPAGASLGYVAGSAKLYDRNMANGRALSDSVVTDGASVGDMRGCFDFLHLVTFDLRVNGPVITPPVPPTPPAKATLKVVKQVVGGTLSANDFELFVGNQRVNNGQVNEFDAGIYTVRENNKPNYTGAFSGECGWDGRINLAAGDNKVCIITNTFVEPPKVGTISLTKNVRNVTQSQTIFAPSIAAKPNDQVEFQMVVTAETGTVNNVIFSDTLPQKLTYVNNSLTVDGVPSGNNLGAVSLGNMSANTRKTVVIRATVSAAGEFPVGSTTLTNTANITSSVGSATATAKVVVAITGSSKISVDKQVRNITANDTTFGNDTSAKPGDTVEFRIVVDNTGNTTAQSVVLKDTLPAKMIFVQGQTDTVNIGNIQAGKSETVLLKAIVKSADEFDCGDTSLTNKADVTSSNAGNDSDTAVVKVNKTCTTTSSLSIEKLARNVTQNQNSFVDTVSASPKDKVEFQIKVTANGNTSAQNVTLTDVLPNNMTLDNGSSLSHDLGNMQAGTNKVVIISATLADNDAFNCGSNNRVNTATADATNTDVVTDSATVVVTRSSNCGGGGSSPVLTITKDVRNVTKNTGFANQTTAVNGERVEFRLIVRNTVSGTTANNVRVNDILPTGLTYVPGTFQVDSGTSLGSLFGGNYQSLGNISGGNSRTLLFQANVDTNANQTLINVANAISDNTNSASAQASVFVSTVAGGNVDLVLSKSAYNQTRNVDATTVTAQTGDVIIYTLRVRNQGNATATNYVFTDDISDVLQLARLNTFDGAGFESSRLTLTWPSVSIPAGSTVEKTFSVVVNGPVGPNADNVMTNVFGNTVNVRVPRVGGFTAPPTGTGTTISLALAFAVMIGAFTFRREKVQTLIRSLTHKNV
ncbi:MAG: DUF11 domain-containing protein [Candidatus Doudnabacteria bacterium]|nr:DUF11 domain-containing protein [Candidatus Doudnabacteria bacterium]